MLPRYTGTFFAFLALNSHHNIASMSQFSQHMTIDLRDYVTGIGNARAILVARNGTFNALYVQTLPAKFHEPSPKGLHVRNANTIIMMNS